MGSRAYTEEEFQRLYRDHVRPVYQYFLRRTDPDVAQDLTAETFMVAWRRLDQVPTGRPLPWLYGVGRNVLRNHQRSQRRAANLLVKLRWSREDRPTEPDRIVVRRDQDQEMIDALVRLRPDDRELLRLAIWEELAYDDIGHILGCSANAVAQRRRRALQQLAKEMRSGGHKRVEAPMPVKGEAE